MVVWHLKQIGKVRKLDKWVPHKLIANQNNCFEVSSSLILCNNNESFLNWIVTCDENWILYGDDQFSGWTEKKLQSSSQSKVCTEKKKGHGHYLVVCCWSDSLQFSEILAKSLHLRSMLNKLMRCTENCNTCHWRVQKDPILLHDNAQLHIPQPALQKLNKLGYKFCFIHYIHLTDYHFFKHLDNFLQGKCFHNQQEAENAFQEFFSPNAWIFILHE